MTFDCANSISFWFSVHGVNYKQVRCMQAMHPPISTKIFRGSIQSLCVWFSDQSVMNCMHRRSIYVGIDRLMHWMVVIMLRRWHASIGSSVVKRRVRRDRQMQESMNSSQLWCPAKMKLWWCFWNNHMVRIYRNLAQTSKCEEGVSSWMDVESTARALCLLCRRKARDTDVDSWPLRVPYQLAFCELRTCFLLMFAIQLGTGDSSQRNSCLQNTDQGLTFSFSHLFFATISYSFIILLDGEKPATILKITVAMRGFRLRHVRRRRFIIYMACPT